MRAQHSALHLPCSCQRLDGWKHHDCGVMLLQHLILFLAEHSRQMATPHNNSMVSSKPWQTLVGRQLSPCWSAHARAAQSPAQRWVTSPVNQSQWCGPVWPISWAPAPGGGRAVAQHCCVARRGVFDMTRPRIRFGLVKVD